MTIEEFNKTGFTGCMKAMYKGQAYEIASVDFEEKLIGLVLNIPGSEEGEVSWVRCENCEIVNDLPLKSICDNPCKRFIDACDECKKTYTYINTMP